MSINTFHARPYGGDFGFILIGNLSVETTRYTSTALQFRMSLPWLFGPVVSSAKGCRLDTQWAPPESAHVLGSTSFLRRALIDIKSPPPAMPTHIRSIVDADSSSIETVRSSYYVLLLIFTKPLFVVELWDGLYHEPTPPARTKRGPRNPPTRAGSCGVASFFKPFSLKPVHFVC